MVEEQFQQTGFVSIGGCINVSFGPLTLIFQCWGLLTLKNGFLRFLPRIIYNVPTTDAIVDLLFAEPIFANTEL